MCVHTTRGRNVLVHALCELVDTQQGMLFELFVVLFDALGKQRQICVMLCSLLLLFVFELFDALFERFVAPIELFVVLFELFDALGKQRQICDMLCSLLLLFVFELFDALFERFVVPIELFERQTEELFTHPVVLIFELAEVFAELVDTRRGMLFELFVVLFELFVVLFELFVALFELFAVLFELFAVLFELFVALFERSTHLVDLTFELGIHFCETFVIGFRERLGTGSGTGSGCGVVCRPHSQQPGRGVAREDL